MPITNLKARRSAIPEVVPEVLPPGGPPAGPPGDEPTSADLPPVEEGTAKITAEIERLERARRDAEAEELRARERAEAARREAEREEARLAALREETARLEGALLQTASAEAVQHVPDTESEAPSRCVIRFWRGYRKGAFYAERETGAQEGTVAESAFFRARGNGVPERTDEAAAAYAALTEKLEAQGWRRMQSGPAWFEATFER